MGAGTRPRPRAYPLGLGLVSAGSGALAAFCLPAGTTANCCALLPARIPAGDADRSEFLPLPLFFSFFEKESAARAAPNVLRAAPGLTLGTGSLGGIWVARAPDPRSCSDEEAPFVGTASRVDDAPLLPKNPIVSCGRRNRPSRAGVRRGLGRRGADPEEDGANFTDMAKSKFDK